MNKRTFLGLIAGSATSALLASGSRARAEDAPTIRIAALATDVAGEAIYGVDSGMFARSGLTIDLNLFNNYGAIQAALVSHAVDVAVFDTLGFAVTAEHDVPIEIIGASAVYNTKTPTLLMCVGSKSSLRKPADLVGKTIAVGTLRGSADVSTRAWLAQNNVDGTTVKIIELPFTQMGPALERGTVDAANIVEPLLAGALQAGTRPFAKIYDAIGPHYTETVWAINSDYAQQNTDLLKRLTKSMYDVARWANANHAQTAQLLVKRAKLDPATAAQMTRAEYATSLDPKQLQPVLDRAHTYGVITKPVLAQTLIAAAFR